MDNSRKNRFNSNYTTVLLILKILIKRLIMYSTILMIFIYIFSSKEIKESIKNISNDNTEQHIVNTIVIKNNISSNLDIFQIPLDKDKTLIY